MAACSVIDVLCRLLTVHPLSQQNKLQYVKNKPDNTTFITSIISRCCSRKCCLRHDACLMVIFRNNRGRPAPEHLHSFHWS